MERHSAVWGEFDGREREGLAEGKGTCTCLNT